MPFLQPARTVDDLDAVGDEDRLGIALAEWRQRVELRDDVAGDGAERQRPIDVEARPQVVGAEAAYSPDLELGQL